MSKKYHYIPQSFILDVNKHYEELMKKYNISISTVYRWKINIQNKRGYKIEKDIVINSRILGILWAIGYDDGEYFIIRNKERYIIEEVKNYFNLRSNIIVGESNTNIQYKIKIVGYVRKQILKLLSERGWSERSADVRKYPSGDIDDKIFIKTYIELHSSFDYTVNGKPRLRIFGNKQLIHDFNDIIPKVFSVARKTPQRVTKKTYALYYQNRNEIEELMDTKRKKALTYCQGSSPL